MNLPGPENLRKAAHRCYWKARTSHEHTAMFIKHLMPRYQALILRECRSNYHACLIREPGRHLNSSIRVQLSSVRIRLRSVRRLLPPSGEPIYLQTCILHIPPLAKPDKAAFSSDYILVQYPDVARVGAKSHERVGTLGEFEKSFRLGMQR